MTVKSVIFGSQSVPTDNISMAQEQSSPHQ